MRRLHFRCRGVSVLATRDEVLGALQQAERRRLDQLAAQERAELQNRRLRTAAASIVLVLTLVGSFFLWRAIQGEPELPTPGRVGVVVLSEADSRVPLDVSVTYFPTRRGTAFNLAVSREGEAPEEELPVALYFCGDVREGLTIQRFGELHELTLTSDGLAVGTSDSRLGGRADCSYAVLEGASAVNVAGGSESPITSEGIASVGFALPGVDTIGMQEPLGDREAWPIAPSSSLKVEMIGAPVDLRILASSPELQEGSDIAWRSRFSPFTGPASEYRVEGVRELRQSEVDAYIFVAGALVGVAGATALWLLELLLDVRSNKLAHRDDEIAMPAER